MPRLPQLSTALTPLLRRLAQRSGRHDSPLLPALVICGGLACACLLALGLLHWEGRPGQATLAGTVTFEGRPFAGAEVSVLGSRRCHGVTDEFGRYRISYAPAGNVTLMVRSGNLRCGFPLRLPAYTEIRLPDLPLFRWP